MAFYVPNLIGELIGVEAREEKMRATSSLSSTVDDASSSKKKKKAFPPSSTQLALPLPHLLSSPGYTRVACAAYAFSVALTRPVQFMAFYFFR